MSRFTSVLSVTCLLACVSDDPAGRPDARSDAGGAVVDSAAVASDGGDAASARTSYLAWVGGFVIPDSKFGRNILLNKILPGGALDNWVTLKTNLPESTTPMPNNGPRSVVAFGNRLLVVAPQRRTYQTTLENGNLKTFREDDATLPITPSITTCGVALGGRVYLIDVNLAEAAFSAFETLGTSWTSVPLGTPPALESAVGRHGKDLVAVDPGGAIWTASLPEGATPAESWVKRGGPSVPITGIRAGGSPSLVVTDAFLYLVGPIVGATPTNRVFVRPRRDYGVPWTETAPSSGVRSQFAALHFENTLYVAGGGTQLVEKASILPDGSIEPWMIAARLPEALHGYCNMAVLEE
jgi:hypothetical protein